MRHCFASRRGYTLVEVLIASAIFSLIAYSMYLAYTNILQMINVGKWRQAAISVVEDETEKVRNLSYQDVGIQGGYPPGKLLAQKAVMYNGISFTVNTTVRNIDDPFDGTLNGTPNDTSPADYRLVEFQVACVSCSGFSPVVMTTIVAPKALETATNNGSLFINVFDAYAKPISGANVVVTNASVTPSITITDTTNINGMLQLVDIPTSTTAYAIQVTKNGYSTDMNYPLGAPGNPNPLKPYATVAQQQLTSVSFSIDTLAQMTLTAANQMCVPLPNVPFSLNGAKLIGANPDVLKFTTTSMMNSYGNKFLPNLEWDNYAFGNSSTQFDIQGVSPSLAVTLNPSGSTTVRWVMAQKDPAALVVSAVNASGTPISGATVTLTNVNGTYTGVTGQSQFGQTDWSNSNYFSQSGGIDAESAPGDLKLLQAAGKYSTTTQEWLISNIFDLGAASTTLYELNWNPSTQPPSLGPNSVEFQIATNNDLTTWNFTGPDGTSNSYYAVSSTLPLAYSNNRYFRYKVLLQTRDQTATPVLHDMAIRFRSPCLTDGQAYFHGMPQGTYSLTIGASGYAPFTDPSVSVLQNWQTYAATLTQ